MKIVFVSNYFNHHQRDLSDNLYKYTGGNYYFIETSKITEERIKLGWKLHNYPEYVKFSYLSAKDEQYCKQVINDADLVIIGSAPFSLVKERLKKGKLVFRYSERVYKSTKTKIQYPLRMIKYMFEGGIYKNMYLLCSSAYAKKDYNVSLSYIGKCFKWGYFPKTNRISNISSFYSQKDDNLILWVGRLIYWKHPEYMIKLAKYLKKNHIDKKILLIGDGPMKKYLEKCIFKNDLRGYIELMGSVSFDKVQDYMKKCKIFIATSDKNEGWGAVINEAMGNACIVVASSGMGSVPYLINHKKNGLIFKNYSHKSMINIVSDLLNNLEDYNYLGINAYKTIQNTWNGEVAAKRVIELSNKILENKQTDFTDGPCSKA